MNKKKITVLCVLAAVLIALIVTLVVLETRRKNELEQLRIYNETYLVMDGSEYRRDTLELDLSGKQLDELHKLQELTALKQLDLRGTGITTAQYDSIQAALPDCEIFWSVPFQGGFVDNSTQELVLETLSEDDIPALAYLPGLSSINADQCRDYDALQALAAQYPDLALTYTVSIGGNSIPHTEGILTITDPDFAELLLQIPRLPNLETVTLEGTLPSSEELAALKSKFPHITFIWNFTVCGVETNSLAEFLDLSGIKMGSFSELEEALPNFYQLSKVDMVGCGFSNEEMDALNKRNPGTQFVWEVTIGGKLFRTDIRFFMPYKHNIKSRTNLDNLRYCKDIEVIDIGHRSISNISFIEDLPKLRCLLVLDCPIRDIYSISACTSLEFLEIAQTPIPEYWLFTNLTNLKDLNISCTPYNDKIWMASGLNDLTMLYQFTWLDRFWSARNNIRKDQYDSIHETLPDTWVMIGISESTGFGWRYSPRYFEHRDIMGMWYMAY